MRIAPASAHSPGANGSRRVSTRPPTRCCASTTIGSCPARASSDAATSPAMPAPTTTTRAPRSARGYESLVEDPQVLGDGRRDHRETVDGSLAHHEQLAVRRR